MATLSLDHEQEGMKLIAEVRESDPRTRKVMIRLSLADKYGTRHIRDIFLDPKEALALAEFVSKEVSNILIEQAEIDYIRSADAGSASW